MPDLLTNASLGGAILENKNKITQLENQVASLQSNKVIAKMQSLNSYTDFYSDMTTGSVPKIWVTEGLVSSSPSSTGSVYVYRVLRDFTVRAWGRASAGTSIYNMDVYVNDTKLSSLKSTFVEIPLFATYNFSFVVPNVTFYLVCQADPS